MSRADYVLIKRTGGWAVDCSGKEFGPFRSWVRAARLAITQARHTRRAAQIRIEGRSGRCHIARVYHAPSKQS